MTSEIKQRIEQIRRGEVPEGYVKTALGLAPANWKRYTFGDIYTERKEPGDENLPLLMVSIHSGVSDGEVDAAELPKQVKRIEDKSQYKKAVSGDLVFNMMRAWQGAIGTVRTTGMVSPAYIVAEPNDKAYPLFMDYYSRTPQMINQIDRQSYGVTDFRKRLYWDSFAPISCALPPIEEQQKIAAILTTQDRVIELKEKCLAEKQRQKKYLMQQLLTGKKRLPGFSEEWKKVKIGSFIKEIDERSTVNNQYEILSVTKNGMVFQSSHFNKQIASENNVGYKVVRRGNLAFSTMNLWMGSLDTLRICDTGIVSPAYKVFEFNQSLMVVNFAENYMKSAEMIWLYKANSEQGASIVRRNLDLQALLNSEVALPDISEQTAIAEVLSAADHEIDLLRQDIEQEKQKKKALMQLLLTGIVRVKI